MPRVRINSRWGRETTGGNPPLPELSPEELARIRTHNEQVLRSLAVAPEHCTAHLERTGQHIAVYKAGLCRACFDDKPIHPKVELIGQTYGMDQARESGGKWLMRYGLGRKRKVR